MPFFYYTALKSGKTIVNGNIEAISLKEAREALRKIGLLPTKIEEQKTIKKAKTSAAKKKDKIVKLKKLGMRDKIDFTNSLAILSKTGIPIVEALLFIELNSSLKNVQKLSAELRRMVLTGSNLSDSVAKYPYIFDQVYTGLVKAGEESGELDVTMERMVFLLRKQDNLRNKVISAMTYPCIVVIMATLVTLVMLTFVFPAFKDMYSNMGKDLPWITQTLMDTGLFLRKFWFTIPLLLGSMAYTGHLVLKWTITKKAIDKILLSIPVVRTFVKYVSLSNFVSVLKVSFDAGVPIIDSLLLANLTIKNFILNSAIRESTTKIQHGQSLSFALKSSNVIPGIIMCMISTGEQSGQLGNMLEHAGSYIDTEVERTLEILNKLLEPLLLVVIGGIVLILGLALYLPLFQSYSNMV
ncbi:MAG: type II secretion system F family protein [bacterium]